jgi:uncharacterized protein (DUF1015 family)
MLAALLMALIKPFAAVRPRPELAGRLCELPYDVLSSAEARQLAAGNPISFLHVSKPEIDLPPDTDPYAAAVYVKGRENFARLMAAGCLAPDPQPCFHLYRQVMGTHAQTGLVALASCEDYRRGIIKRHEMTQPDKEDDRLRHIRRLNAQTGPAFLVYRAVRALDEFVEGKLAGTPATDFVAPDGVRHTGWVISAAADVEFIRGQFAQMPSLYIADGHHRTAAAARLARAGSPAHARAFFLAVIFPHNQVQILPYHRVVKDLGGLTAAQLMDKLAEVCCVEAGAEARPERKHQLGFYVAGQWYRLQFRPAFTAGLEPAARLDVTLLQQHVLAPIFGLADPRASPRLDFVGGIRGTAELEKLVDSGQYAGAFLMYPTQIGDLMAIADAGGMMPPKSTWFEPKLRDGMFCYVMRDA